MKRYDLVYAYGVLSGIAITIIVAALLFGATGCTTTQTRIIVVRQACESELVQPAVECGPRWRLRYDGCRWRCLLEPVEQGPAELTFDFSGWKAVEAKQ